MENFLQLIIIFGILLLSLALIFYIIIVIRFNDFSPKNLELNHFRNLKILFIYPHPDDETMASGGLMSFLTKNNHVKVVSVTPGQYGDEILKISPEELAEIRKKEFVNAITNLGVKDYEVWDFIDGKTKFDAAEIKSRIQKLVSDFKPDLVITYEKHGVYGHPDHVAVSKVIHELSQELEFKTLYSTISQKIFKKIDLPTYMAESQINPTLPEYKFNTLKYAKIKYFAAKSHKSQNLSRGKPLALQMLVNMNEYYTEKWDDSTKA